MNARETTAGSETMEPQNQDRSAAAPAPTSVAEAQTPQPQTEVERLRAELKECQDRRLRALAENQNVSRRLTDEKHTALRYAEADFARSLLPMLDNFERLMAELTPGQAADPFMQGVKLVHEMLRKALADHHVRPIESLGKPFDPKVHDAICREAHAAAPPNHVVTEYQKGYMISDRVLRPAKVGISAAPEEEGIPACAAPAAGATQGDGHAGRR